MPARANPRLVHKVNPHRAVKAVKANPRLVHKVNLYRVISRIIAFLEVPSSVDDYRLDRHRLARRITSLLDSSSEEPAHQVVNRHRVVKANRVPKANRHRAVKANKVASYPSSAGSNHPVVSKHLPASNHPVASSQQHKVLRRVQMVRCPREE